jgi:hypothetical protein
MAAAKPLSLEGSGDEVEAHSIAAFEFHGIPDDVLAGRKEDRWLPVLGKMDRREFGNAVHAVLSRIRTAADAEQVLERPWPWLRCAEDDWEEVRSAVRAVVQSAHMAPWFDGTGRVYMERDVIGPQRKVLRPDRVVDFGDTVDVIDFKTAEEADPGKRGAHAKQVREYMQALQGSHDRQVRGYLYYVTTDELVEVEAL